MPQKYKYFLAVLFLISLNLGVCFARELEVPLPGLSENADLIDYRNFVFMFLIGLGGSLAVLSLVLGAIHYLTSAGNTEAMRNAKSRMVWSIFGLVLLLSSWLIIQTINPNLITVTMTSLKGEGVFLSDGKTLTPAPVSVSDTSTLTQGFNQIKYVCKDKNGNDINDPLASALWVRKFTEKNLGDWTKGTLVELRCTASTSISDAASFMLDWGEAGVYLYTDQNCSTMPSLTITDNQSKINETYIRKTKAFKSFPEPKATPGYALYRYGAVFHSEIGFRGKCSDVSQKTGFLYTCIPINLDDASSITVFNLNVTWQTSGDGVTFYSKPFGWTAGTKAGYVDILPATIRFSHPITDFEKDLKFNYTGIAVSDEEKNLCKNFKECPGSIRIKGDYLVVLYATDGSCEVFRSDVPNLNISWILNPENGRTLSKIVIVAIK